MNVIDRIKAANPHHLVVTCAGEEEPRIVNIPDVRKKWDRVSAILDELPWVRIEARGKPTKDAPRGDVVAVINSEAVEEDGALDGGPGLGALAPFAKMLTETVKHTQQTSREETRHLVEGYAALAGHLLTMLGRTLSMAEDYARLARAAGLAGAAGDSSGAPDSQQLDKLMALIMMGMQQRAAAAAAPKPHPSGVNGSAKGPKPGADSTVKT